MQRKIICFFILFSFGLIFLTSCSKKEYTVKIFKEVSENTYVESKIEKLKTKESVINYQPQNEEHYTINYEKSKLTGDLMSDNDVVIEVYYTANRYSVTFEIGQLELVSGDLSQTVIYNANAVAPEVKDSSTAKFISWDVSFNNVSSDLIVKAVCDSNASLNVYHNYENLDGTYSIQLEKTISVDASKGTYDYMPEEIEHYTINNELSELSCNPTLSDENKVIVYYDRCVYNVKFDISGLDLVSGTLEQKVKFGSEAIAPIVKDSNLYKFIKWDISFDNVSSDLIVKAVCDSNTSINVYHKYENLDGTYATKLEKAIDVDASKGAYTYVPETIKNYTVNEQLSELCCNPTINGENKVIVCYDRCVYNVIFDINGLDLVSGTLEQKVKFGSNAIAPSVKDNSLYKFVQWDNEFNNISSDITVKAVVDTNASIIVNIFKEALNGDYVKEKEILVNANTLLGEYVYVVDNIEHYIFNESKSIITCLPNMLKNESLSIYYDLEKYEVNFELNGLTLLSGNLTQSVPYGGSAIAPIVSGSRTIAFDKWDQSFDNICTDMVINAVCTTDTKVKVITCLETIESGYVEQESFSIMINSNPENYTHNVNQVQNYQFNESLSTITCPLYAGTEQYIYLYYDLNRYTVEFDINVLTYVSGELTQTIPHGGTAVAPVIEDTQTVKFVKWNTSFDNITRNLTISAEVETYKPISTRTDLECIALDLNENYILVNNINLSNAIWTPLGEFTGKLLGNGYCLEGIRFEGQNETGLFKHNSGLIDGIIFKNCSASASLNNCNSYKFSNSFVTYFNEGTIKNCKIIGTSTFSYTNSISQEIGCYSESAFKHYNWSNSFNAGTYTVINKGTIDNCTIEGVVNFNITTKMYYKFNTWLYTNVGSGGFTINSNCVFGGFAAENSGNILSCSSNANIKSYSNVSSTSETSGSGRNDVYANSNVTFGTICGNNYDVINGCRTLVGFVDNGSVSVNCTEAHASNKVTTDESYKRLIGTNSGTITSSVATTS